MAGAAALPATAGAQEKMTICAFSKHFQWTDVKELSELCASFGYEGIDLTLRRGGHVLPARVEEDLPKAVEIIKKAGLTIPMVTTDIVDAKSPNAERVIKTLAAQGIRKYRWGGFRYVDNVPIPKQLEECRARTKDLAAMNKQYGVCAMYHTHSGINLVGASFWDLYLILKDFDTNAVSVNYDVGHAVVEGGGGGWLNSSRLLMPYIRGVAVKDFKWKQNEKGAWVPSWCPLGQGMVNLKRFLPMLKAANFTGPLQLHMEYLDFGSKEKLPAIFRRDVDALKALLQQAGM